MQNDNLAEDMAKELEEALPRDLRATLAAAEKARDVAPRNVASIAAPTPLRAAQQPSLEQLQGQMNRYAELRTGIAENIAKVGRDLKVAFETEIMRLQHDFDTKVAETVERLERERSTALRKARDDYHNRLASIDLLSQRLD